MVLQFVCTMTPAASSENASQRGAKCARLCADEIVARGAGGMLLAYVRRLRSSGVVPGPEGVSQIVAGPPCQGLSAANRWREHVDILRAEQVRSPGACALAGLALLCIQLKSPA